MRLISLGHDQLVQRGVSASVARFLTARQHPIPEFDIFVRPVDEWWDYNIPANAADVVGLWDTNADAYARWTRAGQQEFVLLYHDGPEHTVVAWSEQGMLAELARQYFEFLDGHDEAADRRRYETFTAYIGFRHARLLESYLAVDAHVADFHEEFRSRFGRLP